MSARTFAAALVMAATGFVPAGLAADFGGEDDGGPAYGEQVYEEYEEHVPYPDAGGSGEFRVFEFYAGRAFGTTDDEECDEDEDECEDDGDGYQRPLAGERHGRLLGPLPDAHRPGEPLAREASRCVPGPYIKRLLEDEGWTGFRTGALDEDVAVMRAKRADTGRAYELRIDMCTGEILSARRQLRHYDRFARGLKDREY